MMQPLITSRHPEPRLTRRYIIINGVCFNYYRIITDVGVIFHRLKKTKTDHRRKEGEERERGTDKERQELVVRS